MNKIATYHKILEQHSLWKTAEFEERNGMRYRTFQENAMTPEELKSTAKRSLLGAGIGALGGYGIGIGKSRGVGAIAGAGLGAGIGALSDLSAGRRLAQATKDREQLEKDRAAFARDAYKRPDFVFDPTHDSALSKLKTQHAQEKYMADEESKAEKAVSDAWEKKTGERLPYRVLKRGVV